MNCQRCQSKRVLGVNSKSSDMNQFFLGDREAESGGYVISNAGIGRGDYIRFEVCLDCGQMQGTYPRPELTFGVGTRRELTESELLAPKDLD